MPCAAAVAHVDELTRATRDKLAISAVLANSTMLPGTTCGQLVAHLKPDVLQYSAR
jgi:hypothetical protein